MLSTAARDAISRVSREAEARGGSLRVIRLGAIRRAGLGQTDVRFNGVDSSSPTAAAHTGMGCSPTYPPPVINGNCENWNGCGDTVAFLTNIAATTRLEIQIPSGREFTPRLFIYTGPAATFRIHGAKVAQGPDAHFGAGIEADVYGPASFTPKAVNWPSFSQATPLLLDVENYTVAAADISGVLLGIARHTR